MTFAAPDLDPGIEALKTSPALAPQVRQCKIERRQSWPILCAKFEAEPFDRVEVAGLLGQRDHRKAQAEERQTA